TPRPDEGVGHHGSGGRGHRGQEAREVTPARTLPPMATVEVTFTPLPAHVRTARLVATAVARRSGVDETLRDEVRRAVGEACSRAVEAPRRHCPAEPVKIEMTDQGERFVVVVSDQAPASNATLHGAAA